MKQRKQTITTSILVGGLVIIVVLLLLRYVRRRSAPVITTANIGDVATVTVTPITNSSGPSYPIAPTTQAFVVQYKPTVLQNGQTLIEDIDVEGVIFGKHYDIRVVAPPWDNYNGVAIHLSPVAENLIRIVVVNETGEVLELPELTISALKLN